MSEQIHEEQNRVDAYLNVIEQRILAPIQNTEIRNYCTATLLLLFAAMDGIGKLLHAQATAGMRQRIQCFLDYMGPNYAACEKELRNLRNSLVHNAINVESFLSHTEISTDRHLQKIGAAGFIYVNTLAMHKDVSDAFRRFRAQIQDDSHMLNRAASRLEWRSDNTWTGLDTQGIAIPSLPPPVEFIYAK